MAEGTQADECEEVAGQAGEARQRVWGGGGTTQGDETTSVGRWRDNPGEARRRVWGGGGTTRGGETRSVGRWRDNPGRRDNECGEVAGQPGEVRQRV